MGFWKRLQPAEPAKMGSKRFHNHYYRKFIHRDNEQVHNRMQKHVKRFVPLETKAEKTYEERFQEYMDKIEDE